MKKTIIAAIIIIAAGLAGFSIVVKQNIQKPKSELKTNLPKLNQQKNLRQATLKISGMFCASCATGIEYSLKETTGVIDAEVDYGSESGKVVYDPSQISQKEIIEAVKPYTAAITRDVPLK